MSIIEDWKADWIKKQMECSDHPFEVWLKIAEMLIEGRKRIQADLLSPMGKRWDQRHWQEYLSSIMEEGIKLEQEKGIEAAFVFYEICVAEYYREDNPYKRLNKWYSEKRWYKDNMRVAKANLHASLPEGMPKPVMKFSGFKIKRNVEPKPIDKRNRKS